MAVSSMTGYASIDGMSHHIAFVWELRSVNGKGLDVRLRLPNGFEALEPICRKQCSEFFSRGNFQISLSIKEQSGGTQLVVNQAALDQVTEIAIQLAKNGQLQPASIDGLLNIKGVLQEQKIEPDDHVRAEMRRAVEDGYVAALKALRIARQEEGAALADILLAHITQISGLVDQLVYDSSRTPKAIRERLSQQVSALLGNTSTLDEARLHQEAALLATKADLQEEIDRLLSHVVSAKELIRKGGPIGRHLDFLAQEFNRESNTICSKSNAPSVTQLGLDLKVLIDQFREQIQNVE